MILFLSYLIPVIPFLICSTFKITFLFFYSAFEAKKDIHHQKNDVKKGASRYSNTLNIDAVIAAELLKLTLKQNEI